MKKYLRDPINALTHLGGAVAALVGTIILLDWVSRPLPLTSLGVPVPGYAVPALALYGASLVFMFLSSGIYHSVVASPAVIQTLRKLDHSAIFVLIAGTYTPFCLIAFRGFWQWGFLAIIWTLAVIGIAGKLVFIHAPRWFSAGIYVIMGWLSLFAAREMTAALPSDVIIWLAVGGITYTLGAVIYALKKPDFFPGRFGFHEVWHLFVLLGAAGHFVSVSLMMQSMR